MLAVVRIMNNALGFLSARSHRPRLGVLVCILACCTPALAQDKPEGGAETRPVAVVGGVRISERNLIDEVDRLIPLTYFHSRVPESKMHEFEIRALEALIERALIYQDAVARGLTASREEIEKEFSRALEKAGPQFKRIQDDQRKKLLESYRPLVIRRILLDKNEARFSQSVPAVTREQVRSRYEARRSELQAPLEAHLSHILVKVDPAASEAQDREKRRQIDDARKAILGGRPFAEVAKELSEDIYARRGGDMGVVKQGSFLSGPVDKVAFSLGEGELSQVVSSIYGFHLLRCHAKKPRRLLSLEEAGPRIRAELVREARRAARKRWLEPLRRRYEIRILRADLAGKKGGRAPRQPASRPRK